MQTECMCTMCCWDYSLWKEYGLRIQVPEGAISGPCDIAIKAIVAGQFEFPKGTDLVSTFGLCVQKAR